ncbi:hypothetical protein CDAR_504571 [Caerostris darwini]|uniref:Uncharacterized protein n=2 Tax=Caerostris TaxID=172845 RepID=A0AAV4S8F5_9ARAC|nr:hypothetical protein CDAR_504571 [Caerostris darwini]
MAPKKFQTLSTYIWLRTIDNSVTVSWPVLLPKKCSDLSSLLSKNTRHSTSKEFNFNMVVNSVFNFFILKAITFRECEKI